jgi:hypothetical protein
MYGFWVLFLVIEVGCIIYVCEEPRHLEYLPERSVTVAFLECAVILGILLGAGFWTQPILWPKIGFTETKRNNPVK